MTEKDADVRRMVTLMYEICTDEEKIFLPDSTFLDGLLDDDFIWSIKSVLFFSLRHLKDDWGHYIDENIIGLLSSHKHYLARNLITCYMEENPYFNIFEKFIRVCCATIYFCLQTYSMTGVNFGKLVPDIVMLYYDKSLKKQFKKRGGLVPFVKYIRGHKYTKLGLNKDFTLPDKPAESQSQLQKELEEKVAKEWCKNKARLLMEINQSKGIVLFRYADELLSITRTKLPILPNLDNLKAILCTHEEEQTRKSTEIKRTEETIHKTDCLEEGLQRLSILNSFPKEVQQILDYSRYDIKEKRAKSIERKTATELVQEQPEDNEGQMGLEISNSVSKPKEDFEQKMNGARCNKIVEAVVRYNSSKSSCNASSYNSIQNEVCETLKHLKNTVDSFIAVLGCYDKE